MSLINTEIKPFKATAYVNGKEMQLTEADVKGKWSVFFFYPADFTFVCPTELGDLADNTKNCKPWVWKCSPCLQTHTSYTKLRLMHLKQSLRFVTQ